MSATVLQFRPYLFDRDFELPEDTIIKAPDDSAATAAEAVPPQPGFSEAELCQARADGVNEGRALAVIEAETSLSFRLAAAAERIAAALSGLAHEAADRDAEAARQVVAVALALTRRFLPETYTRHAEAEIGALIRDTLPAVMAKPRLVIRCDPQLAPNLCGRIDDLARQAGYDGNLSVLGDAATAPGDCRIEWAGGGLVRSAARLWQEIDGLALQTLGIDRVKENPSSERENTDV